MQTCESCRHWEKHKDNTGECNKVDYVYCDSKYKTVELFVINVDALDDSGLFAQLITNKDFGCNQHTPKESN